MFPHSTDILNLLENAPEQIKRHFITRQYGIHENLLEQGTPPKQIFILLEGSVRAFHTTSKGNQYLIGLFGKGEVMGEAEILFDSPCFCSVETISQCKAVLIPKPLYQDWMDHDPAFSLHMNKLLAWRLMRISERASTHLSFPMEYSVLKLINSAKDDETLDLNKENIAQYLGTSVRSINRIIRRLIGKGLLQYEDKSLKIVSEKDLAEEMRKYE
ncbi:Crp/Fnr family transcriptional regulator [Limibacter armeniacum]|uniref:Crp/Fnr family transcriptional regulator n=1 Tax=Limibacter armeniacum TaxID=466084 RepID=UPI002FE63B77